MDIVCVTNLWTILDYRINIYNLISKQLSTLSETIKLITSCNYLGEIVKLMKKMNIT